MSDTVPPVIVLAGATGIGKTACSLELAGHLNAEIVSVDSRQVYRYMDIGTAKPAPEERAQVPHHQIDCVDPDEYYSAGRYARDARAAIESVCERGKRALLVGGSGFYLRALMDGLFREPAKDLHVKERLRRRAVEEDVSVLYRELTRIDPQAAAAIPEHDAQRIVRALEVYYNTGETISALRRDRAPDPLPRASRWFCLRRDRTDLYRRIEHRAAAMIEEGLVDEVRSLLNRGYTADMDALKTVGYQEIFAMLNGHGTLDEAVAMIQQHTRNYAKRQMTWFRKEQRMEWVDITAADTASGIANRIRQALRVPVAPEVE